MFFRYVMSLCAIAVLAGCATGGGQNAGSVGIRMSDVDGNVFSGKSSSRFGLSSPNDMWERVQRGFSMPDLDNAVVRDREAWYTRNPNSISRMLGRSDKYLFHVVEELERRNMPTELALLPFVESAFNPQAVSSAKAAGMWQFIPSTGKQYELAQNRFLDDRRDVLRSTRAALDYLQRLYTMFGDWHLALAAYNWGEGNVQRAINRNIAAGRGTSYEELTMPQETRQYVPKLQAIKNIIRNPATFNTALPNVANHPYFDQVKISRDIDVAMAARLAEISVDDFKALNPSLNKPMVIASLTPRILLPWEAAPRFRENLARLGNNRLASWTLWTAPTTMTVAQAAEQTGATEDQLREINRIPPRMMVRAGSALMVPRPDWHNTEISSAVARSSSISFAPEVVLRRITLKAQDGDTLASFASRHGVPVQDVANWNNLSANASLAEEQSVVLNLPQQQATRLLNQQRAEEALAARTQRLAERQRQREESIVRVSARKAASRNRDNDPDQEETADRKSAGNKRNAVAQTKSARNEERSGRSAKAAREEEGSPRNARSARDDERNARNAKAARDEERSNRRGKPAQDEDPRAAKGKAAREDSRDKRRNAPEDKPERNNRNQAADKPASRRAKDAEAAPGRGRTAAAGKEEKPAKGKEPPKTAKGSKDSKDKARKGK
ncbi:MAG: transglycosylase SLT domain-containing protein [Brachymonas denitrificans]|uniref:transglycosylase SLT domain-containing protein n=1 Tax=Brachymonas denitrificans TaxID=28220 RepID=UPI00352F329C